MSGRYLHVVLALLTVLSLEASARAHDGRGAFRLSLDAGLVSWDRTEVADRTEVTTLRFGILDGANLRVGAMYAVTEVLLLGLHFGFAGATQEVDDNDLGSQRQFAVVPSLEAAFNAGGSIRPFVGAGVGVGSTLLEDSDGDETRSIFAVLSGEGGIHWLPDPHVSIDLGLGFRAGLGNVEDQDLRSIGFVFFAGLSGWIGGLPAR